MRLLRLLMIALAVTGMPAATLNPEAMAQVLLKAPQKVVDEIARKLAARFGLPAERFEENVDLVRDLGLDSADVYYAVVEILESYGVQLPPRKEITRVGHIASLAAASTRSFTLKKTAGATEAYVQTVYYATDRRRTGAVEPELAFDGNRSQNGAMSYGKAEVNIPLSHKRGQIETPWLGIQSLRDTSKHIFILKLTDFDESGLMDELRLIGGGKSDLLVYVHGFNVPFSDAIVRAAQVAFDFGFDGAPIVYSWPSDGGITAYTSDAEDVAWSAKHIETLLETLKQQFPGRKLHLVAHSMGSRGLLGALRLMAYKDASKPLFQSVILCAPDFDSELFRDQIAAEVRPLAEQWVVYTSNKDLALTASEQINSAPRLGKPVTYAEGFEIIDASELEVTPWSLPETHSYYATKQHVLEDMVSVIKGLQPEQRGLRPVTVQAGTVWSLQ
ncbi:MAG: alpha/beta fold hydrolase [Hyphomicrobiaceae bacterium]